MSLKSIMHYSHFLKGILLDFIQVSILSTFLLTLWLKRHPAKVQFSYVNSLKQSLLPSESLGRLSPILEMASLPKYLLSCPRFPGFPFALFQTGFYYYYHLCIPVDHFGFLGNLLCDR